MSETKLSPPEVGDWVRFMADGRLTIGKVEYIEPWPYNSQKWRLYTDMGITTTDSLLEVRRRPQEQEPHP